MAKRSFRLAQGFYWGRVIEVTDDETCHLI